MGIQTEWMCVLCALYITSIYTHILANNKRDSLKYQWLTLFFIFLFSLVWCTLCCAKLCLVWWFFLTFQNLFFFKLVYLFVCKYIKQKKNNRTTTIVFYFQFRKKEWMEWNSCCTWTCISDLSWRIETFFNIIHGRENSIPTDISLHWIYNKLNFKQKINTQIQSVAIQFKHEPKS